MSDSTTNKTNKTVKKDSVKKDSVKKDSVKKDSIKKDSVKKDSVKKDSVKKDSVKKDSKKSSKKTLDRTIKQSRDEDIMNPDFVPIHAVIVKPKNNIFDTISDVRFSNNIDYPMFSYGFQHFLHQSKDKMKITKEFDDKKKIYLIMNQFERHVDNYDDDIGHLSNAFFTKNNRPEIISRGFYKLWEILMARDLIDDNNKNFVSLHLAEGPGGFVQSTMYYRDLFSKNSKNDEYNTLTLNKTDEKNHIPDMDENFVKFCEKEKPPRLVQHKNAQTGGDLFDPQTLTMNLVNMTGGEMKNKADFITADGGYEWGSENTQEQEAFRLIFAQIVAGIMNQKKDGNFVIKFFESMTNTTVKFISILSQFYEKIEIFKPLMTRSYNPEKYLICQNFKYDEKDTKYTTYVSKLRDIHKQIHGNQNKNIVDIFSEYNCMTDTEFMKNIIDVNIKISNMNFKTINEIVSFIENQNFFGDVYHMKRQMQVNANKFWVSMFLTDDRKIVRTKF